MRIWSERICRWIVTGVLVWAAVAKWSDIDAFVRTIDDFGLVWPGWEFAAAVSVTLAEIAAGVMLFRRRLFGYGLAGILLIAFTTVIVYGMSIGLDIDCGCLGPADRWAGITLRTSLIRNLLLLAALAAAWMLRPRRVGHGVEP